MTCYLITRHEGTRRWVDIMARKGRLPFNVDMRLEHLDPSLLKEGDVVVGTVPLRVANDLYKKGVTFWSLDIEVPPELRGQELSAVYLAKFGARFTRYEVQSFEQSEIAAESSVELIPEPSISFIVVSAQLAPAAIGWLHQPTEQVILLVSKSMRGKANQLKKWFAKQENPPQVDERPWKDSNYPHLLQEAEKLVANLMPEMRPKVVVNLTGGTKPMSLAMQQAFYARIQSFNGALMGQYVDTAQGQIEDLLSSPPSTLPMKSVLSLNDLLFLNDFEFIAAKSHSDNYENWLNRSALFDYLLSIDWLAFLNSLLAAADFLIGSKNTKNAINNKVKGFRGGMVAFEGSKEAPSFTYSQLEKWGFLKKELLGKFGKLLSELGVCQVENINNDGFTLNFLHGVDEFHFLFGTWLEIWLASYFKQSGVDEWAQGVEVKRGGSKNEFDLIAICGNQSLLVEVKTGNLSNKSQGAKGDDVLYKLDSLGSKLSQNFGERWLVSLNPLSEADQKRAKKNKTKVYTGNEESNTALLNMPQVIEDWVKKHKLSK